MNKRKYVLSLTAGGILYHESIIVAEVYDRLHDWTQTLARVSEQNLLQSRLQSTSKRKLRELSKRLQHLTPECLKLLADGTREEQNMLLWLASCKTYPLLDEFAREVLHEKFVRLEMTILPSDVESFFQSKSIWHEELEQIKDSTRTKLQTVLLRMMKEADLISDNQLIQPKLFSPRLAKVIAKDSPEHFSLFPIGALDVKGLLRD